MLPDPGVQAAAAAAAAARQTPFIAVVYRHARCRALIGEVAVVWSVAFRLATSALLRRLFSVSGLFAGLCRRDDPTTAALNDGSDRGDSPWPCSCR